MASFATVVLLLAVSLVVLVAPLLLHGVAAAVVVKGASGPIVNITADTPWVVTPQLRQLRRKLPSQPESGDMDIAIVMAHRDVSRDFYKVLGNPPLMLASMPEHWHGGPILVFGVDPSLPPEAFTLTVQANTTLNATLVYISGSDIRGCIFAAYGFAEQVLSVDPWYYYLDLIPEYTGWVALPLSYSYSSGEPAFPVRGWFPNDEDMSGGFFKDPLGQNVYTPESFDRMVESLLRMRGNTIIVGTTGFPDEATFRIADRRGVHIAEHHMTPLGLNVWGWPTGLTYSYRLAPDLLQFAWRSLVGLQKDRDMLWSVGMRGLWDEPFWAVDPVIATNAQRGRIIQECIGNQTSIIKEVTGAEGRYFVYMWGAMLSLLEGGFLKIPDDVTIVWADDGTGIIKGSQNAKAGQGLYYHVMMMDDIANQLTEAVPPHRIFQEIGNFYRRGVVNYTIINVSDVRPVPLSLEAIMRFLWDPEPYVSLPPWEAQAKYLHDWSARHFGDAVAADIANVYALYFNISYMKTDDPHELRYGDRYLATWGQELAQMYQLALNGTTPINVTFVNRAVKFVDGPLDYTKNLLFNVTLPLAPRIPARSMHLFRLHTVLQVAIHYYGLLILHLLSTSMLAWLAHDAATATAAMEEAIGALETLMGHERDAEGTGRWHGLYQFDQFDDLGWSRQLFVSTLHSLLGQAAAQVPNQPFYGHLFDYECLRFSETGCANFPFLLNHTAPTPTMGAAVRITCADDSQPPTTADTSQIAATVTARRGLSSSSSSACMNTWTGGVYSGATTAVRLEVVQPHVTVRYTTDGSTPTPSSLLYSGTPFTVRGNVTVRAAAYMGATLLPPMSASEFVSVSAEN